MSVPSLRRPRCLRLAVGLGLAAVLAACSRPVPSHPSPGTAPAAATAAPSEPARTTTPAAAVGRLVVARVPGPSLQHNAFGDPSDPEVAVYLPPGYDAEPERRYPVLYLLHGIGSTHEAWTGSAYGVTLQDAMDRAVAAQKVPPMIVVMPNARTRYGGSFYVNSSVNGDWADYIADDLVAHVDATYRTLAARDSRGVAGHSMGGYGAVLFATRRPDVFGAAYALSPCCLAWVAELGPENPAWRRLLRVKDPRELGVEASRGNFYVPGLAAMAAAWSPNPERPPLLVDLPFALDGDRLVPAEPGHSAWQRAFPLGELPARTEALRSLRGLVIDVGDREDFPHITEGVRLYGEALTAAGIEHRLEAYPGDHMSGVAERLQSEVLPFFGRTLAR